jgi:hypothetical protein
MMVLCIHDFLLLCCFICGYPYNSAEMLLVPWTGTKDMAINGYDVRKNGEHICLHSCPSTCAFHHVCIVTNLNACPLIVQ